jgi:hypothetical protein
MKNLEYELDFTYTPNTPFTVPVCTKIIPDSHLFVKNVYTKFHENPTNNLVTDTNHGRMDRQMRSPHKHLFTFHKEGLKSYLRTCLKCNWLLITFVGLEWKCMIFISCCFLMFLTHLILPHNYSFSAFYCFFPMTPSETVDKGFTVSYNFKLMKQSMYTEKNCIVQNCVTWSPTFWSKGLWMNVTLLYSAQEENPTTFHLCKHVNLPINPSTVMTLSISPCAWSTIYSILRCIRLAHNQLNINIRKTTCNRFIHHQKKQNSDRNIYKSSHSNFNNNIWPDILTNASFVYIFYICD